MKYTNILGFMVALLCFTATFAQAQPYAGEVDSLSSSKEQLFKSGEYFLLQLPQENGLTAKDPKGSLEKGELAVKRSFLVQKKQLSVLSHAIADVCYTAELKLSEGQYSYVFTDFKVYTYKRDRYGKYSRSNSKGQQINSLSGEMRVIVQESIAAHINSYIANLKASVR